MELNIKWRWGLPVVLLASALVVTGCGGGGRSGAAPAPKSGAPTVSAIAAQTINQDTPTSALAFTVSDDGGLDNLIVVVSSGDSTLLPSYGLVLGGSGASRTITVTPAEDAIGTASVSVTASDAQGNLTSSSFPVTVKAVSQSIASYTNSAFGLTEGDAPVQVSGFTFVQDADDDATFAALLQ